MRRKEVQFLSGDYPLYSFSPIMNEFLKNKMKAQSNGNTTIINLLLI